MNIIKLLNVFCICMTTIVANAQMKTFVLTDATPTHQIEIKTNEVVQVLFHHDISEFQFIVNGVTNRFSPNPEFPPPGGVNPSDVKQPVLPIIAGPATMIVTGARTFNTPPFTVRTVTGIFTIKTTIQTDTLTPLSTVIIPSDANGQVNVILESSTNMVSWTAALPGTYGRSAQARFFRVRAEYLE